MLFSRESFSKTCAISSGKNTRTFSPGPAEINSKPQSTDTFPLAEKVLNRHNSPKIQGEYFFPDFLRSWLPWLRKHTCELQLRIGTQTETKRMKILHPLSSPAEYSAWHSRKLAGFASIPAARSAGNATTARCAAGALAAFCLPDGRGRSGDLS